MYGLQKFFSRQLWKKYALLLVLIFGLTRAKQDDTQLQLTRTQTGVCTLREDIKVEACIDEAGDSVTTEDRIMMPFGSTCIVTGTSRVIHCYRDGWTRDTGITGGKLLSRQERAFAATGALIGSFFGPGGTFVGGLIGFAVDLFCLFICSGSEKPPNQPPKITCAISGSTVIADKRSTLAKMEWASPSATDPEGEAVKIEQNPSNYKSGKQYEEGTHTVHYIAVDNHKYADYCFIQFTVKVIRCAPPDWPENGRVSCNGKTLYGSVCKFSCEPGFSVSGAATSECMKNGQWSAKTPNCLPNRCEAIPSVTNGNIKCENNAPKYGDMCYVQCNSDYTIVKGPSTVYCNLKGAWSTLPACKDTTPPKFDQKTCRNIQKNIDSKNNTAMVEWDVPVGKDNSGDPPIITELNRYKPGQRFEAGVHIVQYAIKDASGNEGHRCMFNIIVQTISCQPPSLNVQGAVHMKYNCPDVYRLGAECYLSCRSGYPLAGENKIQCLNDPGSNPPVLRWQWDKNGLEPYCREIECPELSPPLNGALACSLWAHGNMCQIQCEEGYDVSLASDGLYVCGKSTGKWRPNDDVPNCNRKRNAKRMNLPSALYYYTGKCNSSTENLLTIQNNFVQALNTSKFFEYCVGVRECQAKFVNVTCGEIQFRRKRDVQSNFIAKHRRATSKLAYTVTFDISLPLEDLPNKTKHEVFADMENEFYDMVDQIANEVTSGQFDINIDDMHLESDSFDPGEPDLDCPKGTIPRKDTYSCVGCPSGQYFSMEKYGCKYCPIGTHQDETDSVECKLCPSNSTTLEQGSVNSSQCLEYCTPGFYSTTGLSPCAACPSNAFQPKERAMSCLLCDPGRKSLEYGSMSEENCQVYDVQVTSGRPVRINNEADISTFTLSTWIYISGDSDNQSIIKIESLDNTYYQHIFQNGTLSVDTNGLVINIDARIKTSKWSHIVITIIVSPDKLSIYQDGDVVHTEQPFNALRTASIMAGDSIELNGDIQLSSFGILDREPSYEEITLWSSACNTTLIDPLVSMDDLALLPNSRVVIPSLCDLFDNCEASPCGSHECEDGVDSYICHCLGGYTGQHCETPPDFCLEDACRNGATCITGDHNYTCTCQYGYFGAYCEKRAVDGVWSEWSEPTSCSNTCGGGVSTRTRACDSPPPDLEGSPCVGNNSMSEDCNMNECPVCLELKETQGTIMECNVTDEANRCSLSCTPGLIFSEAPQPYYECGLTTGYRWTHQDENNPSATLPSCSKIDPPKQLAVSFDGTYERFSCTSSNVEAAVVSLNAKIPSLSCAKLGLCDGEITRQECISNTLSVTVELKSVVSIDNSGLELEKLANNKTEPSSALRDFINQTVELERSAQELFNSSQDFFEVIINGFAHTIESELTYIPKIQCSAGRVKSGIVCAVCPAGSYSDGETVTFCPLGQYQDETGQSECKPCPGGKTTLGIGSINITDCEYRNDTEDVVERKKIKTNDDNHDEIRVGLAVGITIFICIVIVSAVVIYNLRQKRRRQRMKIDTRDEFHGHVDTEIQDCTSGDTDS